MATAGLSTSTSEKRQRVPAAERRDALIDAALEEFAQTGLHGTPVDRIARRVGVAQPYVFSLFPTKRDLFIAAVERGFERVMTLFTDTVAALEPGTSSSDILAAIGDSYLEQLAVDRSCLMLQLQAYASCDDELIAERVRGAYARLGALIMELSGCDEQKLDEFLAFGMYLSVNSALGSGRLDAILEAKRATMDAQGISGC
jgi:AcrR family transcriptional regulator